MELDPQYVLGEGDILDRYRVEGLLGRGGMAVVYRIRHTQLGTPHALKILTIPSVSVRARLLTEGRVQAALRHPNIVAVTDVIEVGGAPGLVLEYIGGPALDDFLGKHRLSWDQVDTLARGLIAGVAHAHEAGLVHRDLKPGNVLLASQGRDLLPKIADFGLAKVLSSEIVAHQTRSGVAMGTPAYMAPEQIRDAKNVDARADIFSLGALLYELATNARAFDGADTFELFSAVTSGDYVPPREHAPDMPQRMERAIRAALQVDRDARVPTAEALLDLWTDHTSAPRPIWSEAVLAASRPESVSTALSQGTATAPQPPSDPTYTEDREPGRLPSAPTLVTARSEAPTLVAPPSQPPRRRAYALWIGALLVVSGGIAVVAAGVGITSAWWLHTAAPPIPPPAVQPASAPPAVTAPRVDEVHPPTVVPTPPQVDGARSPAVAPRAPAVSSPEGPSSSGAGAAVPADTTPAAVVAPPRPPSTGRVRTDSDVPVTLTRDGKRYAPGELAPGTYQVRAEFRGQLVPSGAITVVAGEEILLSCDPLMRMCKAKAPSP